MLLSSSDATGTLMHLFLFTNTAQREQVTMYADNTQQQLTFLLLLPWFITTFYKITPFTVMHRNSYIVFEL